MYTSWKYGSRQPSRGTILPSGASQVGSRTLLALASGPRLGSATTQSSLHQPGFCAASDHLTVRAEPSAATTFISPDSISLGVHVTGLPARSVLPSLVTSASQVPSLTSVSR